MLISICLLRCKKKTKMSGKSQKRHQAILIKLKKKKKNEEAVKKDKKKLLEKFQKSC